MNHLVQKSFSTTAVECVDIVLFHFPKYYYYWGIYANECMFDCMKRSLFSMHRELEMHQEMNPSWLPGRIPAGTGRKKECSDFLLQVLYSLLVLMTNSRIGVLGGTQVGQVSKVGSIDYWRGCGHFSQVSLMMSCIPRRWLSISTDY